MAPQIFAASIAPGERFGADAATLRRTLGSALPTLLHNLPWGSDAAMYAMAAPNLTLTLTLTLPLFLTPTLTLALALTLTLTLTLTQNVKRSFSFNAPRRRRAS